MSGARGIAVVAAVGVLAAPGAALAQIGGGAGDSQYQDPFASQQAPSAHRRATHPSSSGSSNGLSQTPNLAPSSGSTTPAAPAAAPSTAAATARQLPNTGSDPRVVVLAGIALLLAGIGLRLRTADEKF